MLRITSSEMKSDERVERDISDGWNRLQNWLEMPTGSNGGTGGYGGNSNSPQMQEAFQDYQQYRDQMTFKQYLQFVRPELLSRNQQSAPAGTAPALETPSPHPTI